MGNMTENLLIINKLNRISKPLFRLIAIDQLECTLVWSFVKQSNVFQRVCSAVRIVLGYPGGSGGFEKVGILERKQMAHVKSKGPL